MIKIEEGKFYFLKDSFFERMKDSNLVQNKDNGNKRPCYYCFRDKKEDELIWFVPISSKVSKYKKIYEEKLKKYKRVDTLVFGKVNSEDRVFLIQNMFPIIKKFIDSTYTRKNMPVRINYELQNEIEAKANKVLILVKKGNKGLVFPNITNIKEIMIKELIKERT